MASDDARAATNANGERVGVARVARDAADLERRAHVISGRVAQLDSNSKSLKLELSALNDAPLEYEAKAKSGDATYLTPEVRNSMYTAPPMKSFKKRECVIAGFMYPYKSPPGPPP